MRKGPRRGTGETVLTGRAVGAVGEVWSPSDPCQDFAWIPFRLDGGCQGLLAL
jgi:hypothetical protein